MDRPTLQQLSYLVAIAEHGHAGRAAAACFVTQPALSAQLKELERRIGVPLTERLGRSITLTTTGATLARRSEQVLRDVDDLVSYGRADLESLQGPLHLGAIPTLAPYLFPNLVATTRAELPKVELHLHELQTHVLLDQLRQGRIDLAVLARPFDEDSLTVRHFFDDELLLAMPEDHHLVDTEPVSPSVLATYEVLLLADGHCLRDHALAVCAAAGRNTRGDPQSTSLSTLCQMVAAGLGITLLPRSALTVETRPGTGIHTRQFLNPTPSREIVVAWRSGSPSSAHYDRFVESAAFRR